MNLLAQLQAAKLSFDNQRASGIVPGVRDFTYAEANPDVTSSHMKMLGYRCTEGNKVAPTQIPVVSDISICVGLASQSREDWLSENQNSGLLLSLCVFFGGRADLFGPHIRALKRGLQVHEERRDLWKVPCGSGLTSCCLRHRPQGDGHEVNEEVGRDLQHNHAALTFPSPPISSRSLS